MITTNKNVYKQNVLANVDNDVELRKKTIEISRRNHNEKR